VEESGLESPEEVSKATTSEDKSGGDELDQGGLEEAPAISNVNPTLMGLARREALKPGIHVSRAAVMSESLGLVGFCKPHNRMLTVF
jgi:hypothetical protein